MHWSSFSQIEKKRKKWSNIYLCPDKSIDSPRIPMSIFQKELFSFRVSFCGLNKKKKRGSSFPSITLFNKAEQIFPQVEAM